MNHTSDRIKDLYILDGDNGKRTRSPSAHDNVNASSISETALPGDAGKSLYPSIHKSERPNPSILPEARKQTRSLSPKLGSSGHQRINNLGTTSELSSDIFRSLPSQNSQGKRGDYPLHSDTDAGTYTMILSEVNLMNKSGECCSLSYRNPKGLETDPIRLLGVRPPGPNKHQARSVLTSKPALAMAKSNNDTNSDAAVHSKSGVNSSRREEIDGAVGRRFWKAS